MSTAGTAPDLGAPFALDWRPKGGLPAERRRWLADPVAYVRDRFGVTPDRWQERALRAIANGDQPRVRLAMQACAGPGKSAVLAWAGWWVLECKGEPGKHPNGAAVSMTGDNLRDGLWKELAVWQARSPYLCETFDWTATRICHREHPETWWLSFRTYAKSANPEEQGRTLSGLHSPVMFYLIDESGSVPTPVLRAAEQGLSSCEWGMIAQAGNPTSTDGVLYHSVVNQSAMWEVIRISGDPLDADRSPRINAEWAAEQIQEYGRDNAWVMAYILGQFPPGGLNTLLGPDEVRAAMQRHLRAPDYDWAQKRLGIDVARFGDDRTVLFPRQGLVAFPPTVMRHQRATEIAARALVLAQEFGQEQEFVDDTGTWGAGVVDCLLSSRRTPLGIPFSAPPLNPRYANRRTEMWFEMAQWVKRGGALPNIPELVAELTTPMYEFKGGKIALEDKDQIKKRLGKSPDLADALALTFALPEQPAGMAAGYGQRGHVLHDWDPLAQMSAA